VKKPYNPYAYDRKVQEPIQEDAAAEFWSVWIFMRHLLSLGTDVQQGTP